MSDYSINLADKSKYVVGIEDVKQCWGTILSTIPGSIPLQPELGSNLFKYLDQPVNKAFSEMANTIIKDLDKWEKRAKVKRIEKKISLSTIQIIIYGIYRPTKEEIIQNIKIIENNNGGIGSMIIGSTFIIR